MTRCAVLDLGSNSFHLLVADIDGGTVRPVRRQRETSHLRRSVARHGSIPADLEETLRRQQEHSASLRARAGAGAT